MKEKKDDNILLEKVYPNPNQPRKDFDPDKLEELSMSIREYGVLEPIVVTPRDGRYMIIAGERRYRASLLAGLISIPARIIEADDALVEELALLENIQRQDLNIIEEAKAYQALLDRGWSKEDLARKLGFKQLWRIDERTSLLKLTGAHQAMVVSGEISNSQAFEMSRLPAGKQPIVLRKILKGELNSYNKLRAFVDGLLMIESQEVFFSLTTLNDAERGTLEGFKSSIASIERFLKLFHTAEALSVLRKVTLHTDVDVQRIDLIIQNLQKIRKSILAGEGIKKAVKEAA